MKILIVEDREEDLYLLETLLKGSGYEVASAKNGVEALERLKIDAIDIIISDILMPKMDGYQLCRECKSHDTLRKIPFVFYTATYTDKKDEDFALSLGAEKFIIKPVEPDAFLKILENVIKEHEEGVLVAPKRPIKEEEVYLKQYNERLIQKLEKKMLYLEREIVERKRVEDSLRASEEKWRSLVENAPDIIMTIDREGTILFINHTVPGLTPEQTIGTSVYEYVPPEYHDTMRDSFTQVFKTGEAESYEVAGVGPDGSTSWYLTHVGPLKHNGKVVGLMQITRDITERKRAEKEKEQLQAQLR